jgi:tetratricopeptide (TPR) repeat protein
MSAGRRVAQGWGAVAAVPVLFAAIAVLQVRIDAQTRSAAQQKEELVLSSGPMLKKMSLGYDSLLADIYWTRAVQYYGGKLQELSRDYSLLPGLLDITTTLDPHLLVAYRFGAIFLSEHPPGGAGRVDLAIELVKRGIAANPDNWDLDANLGFLYYWHLKDYAKASEAYLEASRNPKAPAMMKMMAARIAQKGGDLDTSMMIWAQYFKSSQDPQVRKTARDHIEGLQAVKDERAIDALSEQFHSRFGRYPTSTKDLRDARMLAGIPVDPAGVPYIIGLDGKSRLDPSSTVRVEVPPKLPNEK